MELNLTCGMFLTSAAPSALMAYIILIPTLRSGLFPAGPSGLGPGSLVESVECYYLVFDSIFPIGWY